jgi:hypothetical protein
MGLVATESELGRAMAEALEATYTAFGKPKESITPDVVEPKLLERLKLLGYVGD